MAFKVENGPKIDIFIVNRKGFYVPMEAYVEQLVMQSELCKNKLAVIKERKNVLEKLIRNNRYNIIRSVLFGLTMLASVGAIMSSEQQAKKVGGCVFWGSTIINIVAGTVLHHREKKLEKQDVYWLKKERELERV